MDWYYRMQQGLDCYSLRCDLFKIPEKTSGLVDTGASQVVLGLFIVFGYGSRSFGFAFQVHHFWLLLRYTINLGNQLLQMHLSWIDSSLLWVAYCKVKRLPQLYAFVILIHLQQTEPTIAVKCGGNMPNLTEFLDMDSHHPESAALFTALCFVWQLLQQYPWGPFTGELPALQCCLDNKSVAKDDLDWTFDNVNTPVFNFLKADYDILQGILQAINELPLKATVHWVKGHQDHHKPLSKQSGKCPITSPSPRGDS